MPWEGGRLGVAAVSGQSFTLNLNSRDARPDGTAAWTERRVIDLNAVPTFNEPGVCIMIIWFVLRRALASSSSAQAPASSRLTWNQAESRRCSVGDYSRSFLTRASVHQIMLRAADHHCQGNVAVHPFQNIMIDEASAVK